MKDLVHVQVEIFRFAGIPCRVHSRSASQGIDLETGVVRKAVAAFEGMDEFGFLTGVLLQRVTRLGDVFGDSEIRRSVQFEALSQDFRRFAELSAVAGCKNYLGHVIMILIQR